MTNLSRKVHVALMVRCQKCNYFYLSAYLVNSWHLGPATKTPTSPNKEIDGNSPTCGKLQQAQTNRHPECTQKATTPMIWPQLLHFFLLQPRHDSVITSEKIGLSEETGFMTERLCAVQEFHAQLAAVPLSFLGDVRVTSSKMAQRIFTLVYT